MGGRRSEAERQAAAVCLVGFAALLLALVVVEVAVMAARSGPTSVHGDFVQKANVGYVMTLFLAYLVLGGLGLVGTLGLVRVFGPSSGLVRDVARFAALAYFTLSYWLWSAVGIVQHRLTTLAERAHRPPEWVLQQYEASDTLWSFAAWAAQGPAMLLFVALAALLLRSERPLAKAGGWLFGAMAVSQFLALAYVGVAGIEVSNTGRFDFGYFNDLLFTALRIAAFVVSGAALYTERASWSRGTSRALA